ncbi:MAG: putative Uroporphyrinogen decarboxylase [Promethearchaeota archaeon]|nr:MAG: putative Uroporphyrinogen decarboxylase [Candidatus Lokiarchaeota archaeon]
MESILDKLQTEFFKGVLAVPGSTIPSFPIILGYSIWAYSNHTGIPAYEIMKDGEKHGKAQLYVAKKYDLPFVVSFTDLNIIGEALGAELTYMEDVIPVHETPAIRNTRDIDTLEPADPKTDGRMPEILKSAALFVKNFKNPKNILMAGCEGPITAGGSIWGMENLMRNMINNPDYVHKVLDIATDSIIEFLNFQLSIGLEFVTLADPSASCTCISPEFFKKFAIPHYKKIVKKVNSPIFMVHICGESLAIIEDLIRIPKIMIMSVDDVDMNKAKEIIKKKFIILMGNVSTHIMRYGTPLQVEKEVKRVITQAGKDGRLLVSSACDISPGTPSKNIWALINAVKKYGVFPLGDR